jgi:hypothetical protein
MAGPTSRLALAVCASIGRMADNIANRHEITIEVDGRSVTGTYTVWAGVITVSTALGTKATQVDGSSGSSAVLNWLAKRMLRKLAKEGNA